MADFFDDEGDGLDGVVDLFIGGVFGDGESDGGVCDWLGDALSEEDGGGFERTGGAGGAGGGADFVFGKHDEDCFRFEGWEADVDGVPDAWCAGGIDDGGGYCVEEGGFEFVALCESSGWAI